MLRRLLFSVLVLCGSVRAEVTVASICSSNMVLQRDRPVPVWGWATPGESVTVEFTGQTIVVWSDKVPKPVAVRYAWAENPVCNLANGDNLPMFQFHTDNWDQSQLVIPADTITIPAGWVPR